MYLMDAALSGLHLWAATRRLHHFVCIKRTSEWGLFWYNAHWLACSSPVFTLVLVYTQQMQSLNHYCYYYMQLSRRMWVRM